MLEADREDGKNGRRRGGLRGERDQRGKRRERRNQKQSHLLESSRNLAGVGPTSTKARRDDVSCAALAVDAGSRTSKTKGRNVGKLAQKAGRLEPWPMDRRRRLAAPGETSYVYGQPGPSLPTLRQGDPEAAGKHAGTKGPYWCPVQAEAN